MVKYRGKNQVMWDAWFLPVGDEVHAFHLQMPVQDPEHPAEITWNVGHIRTRDLLHWEACPDILPPLGDANEQDYGCKFTGCAYTAPDGEHLVYYTMRDKAKGNQRIGVARSRDLVTFEPDAGNPVLEPDPALCVSYENFDRYDWDIVDCRDLVVVRDPDSGLYYGYVAVAADVGREHPVGAVIVAESRDLLHWEKQSIAYVPQQNGVIEVPDVFEMDGKWYLTMLSGANYAGRSICRDDYVVNCTIYAVADHPRGPFLEAADNPFIGGIVNSGFTCRTVCFGGKRYLYYVDRAAGGETLSLPKEVRACGGRLRPYYAPILEKLRVRDLLAEGMPEPCLEKNSFAWHTYGGRYVCSGEGYTGRTEAWDYQNAFLPVTARSLELRAEVAVEAAGAGFAVQVRDEAGGVTQTLVFSIEPDKGRILLLQCPSFTYVAGREFPFQRGKAYGVRLLLLEGVCEVYIDDELLLQCGVETGASLRPGFFCDRGGVEIRNLEAYELEH